MLSAFPADAPGRVVAGSASTFGFVGLQGHQGAPSLQLYAVGVAQPFGMAGPPAVGERAGAEHDARPYRCQRAPFLPLLVMPHAQALGVMRSAAAGEGAESDVAHWLYLAARALPPALRNTPAT